MPDGACERRLRQPTAWVTDPGGGGDTSTSKPVVSVVLIPWSVPRIVGIMRDTVYSSAQDPDAQVGPDTWITEIQTYLKDNILLNGSAFAD
jgi:hypothetical protein